MREIRFRAWDIAQKMMIEGGRHHVRLWLDFHGMIFYNDNQSVEMGNYAQSNFILMQFTGLKDKHGKEIYEGDIIKPLRFFESHGPGEIVYLAPGFAYKPNDHRYGIALPSWDYRYPDFEQQFEIIGNIYENPEMLKSE